MSVRNRPSLVNPRSVATLVGGACLVALAVAVAESGGRISVGEAALPGLVAVGLGAFVAGMALRYRASARNRVGRRRGHRLEEAEVRALLDRLYPGWEDGHRRRVATAISYHRRRSGSHD